MPREGSLMTKRRQPRPWGGHSSPPETRQNIAGYVAANRPLSHLGGDKMRSEFEAAEIQALADAVSAQVNQNVALLFVGLRASLLEAIAAGSTKLQAKPVELTKAVINIREVKALTGLGETTIWRRVKEGIFPDKVRLSTGRVGWLKAEVLAWIDAQRNSA